MLAINRVVTLFLMIMFFLVACERSSQNIVSFGKAALIENSPPADINPCDIALTPQVSGKVYSGEHETMDDIARYQRAVIQSNTPVPYLEHLGWAYISRARNEFDSGFYKLAEQTALCIEEKQVKSSEAMLLRGHVLHSLHKFKQAETLATKLVEQRGLWFDYGLLGDVLLEQGKLDRAIVAYQVMLDQRPGPQAYSRAAQIRWIKGDVEGAIEMIGLMVKAQGTRDRESAAWAQTRLADYLAQKNQLKKANARIDRALQWRTNYAPALLLRGRIQLMQGNSSAAIKTLTQATQLNTLPEYQWALIEALRAGGRFDSADKVELKLSSTGEIEDPRTLAMYLATVGKDIPRALRLAKQELKTRMDVFTLDVVAWAFHMAGNTVKAREYSELALLEGTLDARLLLHAAIIASASGDRTVSRALFNKVATIQHMLLPSEHKLYLNEFATIQSQISMSPTDKPVRRN